ncbi:MAG: response regulator [bacterium]|nr:response regulator [bacterium]
MRYIPIEKAKEGMILATPLYDSGGRILIGGQSALTQNYIEGLIRFGFTGIYIEDEFSKGIEVESVISPQLREAGMQCIKQGNIDQCRIVSKQIVEEILDKGFVSMDLMDLRSYTDHTYAHSVNVAVLCGVMGMGKGLPKDGLEKLVLAALLHDLGKLKIPDEILNKPGRLTPEEYNIMKTHSTMSYEAIKERWDISAEVKVAVLYHHENVDGSGYPKGCTGDELSLYAKMLHVADVYDALVSKRPYKNPYSPYEACEYLMGGCGIMFDKECVDLLMKYVPLYPKGTEVTLSDGRAGIVYENSGINNLRPVIRLFEGGMLDLSLRDNMSLSIVPPKSDLMADPAKDEQNRNQIKESTQIFVVDDMQTNILMLQKSLSDRYDVVGFTSGEELLAKLPNIKLPELILMDIDMPGMNGIETAKRVLEITNRSVPILFITTHSDLETVLACKQLGVAGYIVRPYNEVYLKGEVHRVLNRREQME